MAEQTKLIGDWNKLQKHLSNINSEIFKNVKKASGIIGEQIDANVTKHLDNQDINWIPLSKEYLKRKIREKKSTDIYTYSGTFRQNIAIELFTSGLGGFVGVKRGVKGKEGEDLVELGYVLEFGSEKVGIPERPLWRPALEEMADLIIEIYQQAIKGALKKHG